MIDDALFGVVTQEPQENQLNGITVVRKLHRMDKTYGDFALSLRSSYMICGAEVFDYDRTLQTLAKIGKET